MTRNGQEAQRDQYGRTIRVGVVALGEISKDTGGRTYLTELLAPLGQQPDLEITVHYADPSFGVPANCRAVRHRISPRLGAVGRIAAEAALAIRLSRSGVDVLFAPFNFLPTTWRGPSVVVQHNVLSITPGLSGDVSGLRAWYRPRATGSSLRRATQILTVSEYLRRLVLQHYANVDPDRVTVAPCGVSALFRHRGKRSPEGHVLVVSALWDHKRVDQAIEAFAVVAQKLPFLELRVAGPASPAKVAKLKALALELGISSRVSFLGNVPHARLADLYASAAVLLHLSEIEAVGFPVLEAMASGVAIIAKRTGGVEEVGGDIPVWVDVGESTESIAVKLHRLLTDPVRRSARERAGQERALLFTWERTAAITAESLRHAAISQPRVA